MTRAVAALFGADSERLSYRGMLVFATATGLLLAEKLPPEQWLAVSLAFMALDKMAKLVRKREDAEQEPDPPRTVVGFSGAKSDDDE